MYEFRRELDVEPSFGSENLKSFLTKKLPLKTYFTKFQSERGFHDLANKKSSAPCEFR